MRSFLVVVALVLALLPASPAAASCGAEDVTVTGRADEQALACDALRAVEGYFAAFDGGDRAPAFRIVFVESIPADDSAASRPVTGTYWRSKHLIEVTSLDSRSAAGTLHWHLPWSRQIAQSVVTHEIVHAFTAQIEGSLPVAWIEYMAYAIQFELMAPDLRRTILAAYPDARAFSDNTQVCDINYLIDPDLFAVRAYLDYLQRGGHAYVASILGGEVDTRPPRHWKCE